MRGLFKILPSNLFLAIVLAAAASSQTAANKPDTKSDTPNPGSDYVGSEVCVTCHAEQGKSFEHTIMGNAMMAHPKTAQEKLGCEGCHGPGQAHADNPDVKLETPLFGPCLRCHEANPSRPKWHKQIEAKSHYSSSSKCTECHVPHAPSEVP